MLQDFIDYLLKQVDVGIYVWGGQTQVIKGGKAYKNNTLQTSLGDAEAWIKKVETSSTNANRVIKLYRKRKETVSVIPCFDCSGLGMSYIQNISGLSKSDMTANGMKGKCELIGKSKLKKGDWVFRTYTSGSDRGRAYHVGFIVDDDLNVVEAYGRDKGVIKRPIDTDYWNTYGRPSYFKSEIEKDEPASYVFTRILKRTNPMMKGDDVKALQRLLNAANDAGLAEDGKLGDKTKKAIKAYQKLKRLTVDGKAGKNTITALGGTWAK